MGVKSAHEGLEAWGRSGNNREGEFDLGPDRGGDTMEGRIRTRELGLEGAQTEYGQRDDTDGVSLYRI